MTDEAAEARSYIALFREHTLPGTDWVRTSSGREIRLDDMTDADAIFIACEFRGMEAKAAARRQRRGGRSS